MRVLVIGPQRPDSFADNIVDSLRGEGHDVWSSDLFPGVLARDGRMTRRASIEVEALPKIGRRLQRHVLERVEEVKPELVLNVDHRLAYPLVADIRAVSGASIALWFPDSPGNVRRETFLLADYDAYFCKDATQVKRYRATLGLNAFYLPEACNPRWHRPIGPLAGSTQTPSVVMAGNMGAGRYTVLQELVQRGMRVQVYGARWAKWLPRDEHVTNTYTGRSVLRYEKAVAFRSASVVLNNLASHEADGLNARLFEAAGCGAVVLTEFRSGLPNLFQVPAEVASYEDAASLHSQIFELAALATSEREAMGERARARAHRSHTYVDRFRRILDALSAG
jgi:spore maturation protein CgeB